jgi:outer membrane lipase/esterase
MIDFKPFTRLRSFLGHGLARGATALGLTAALLAGCGGSSQVETFVPNHLHVFGDELTVLDATGHRYGINGVNTTTTTAFDCALLPLWPQTVAAAFGLVFEQCPGTATTFTAFGHGAYGATVATVEAQLDAQAAVLVANDVVAIQVGMNDVVELHSQVVAGSLSQAAAEAEALARGKRMAARVPGLIARGVKVVMVSPPYLGTSPWALAQGSAAAAAIGRISDALGAGITLDVGQLDARDVVLANGSDVVDNYVNGSNNGSGINVTAAACKQAGTALLGCLSNDLVTTPSAASATTYLWADAQRPGYIFHSTVSSTLLSLLSFF